MVIRGEVGVRMDEINDGLLLQALRNIKTVESLFCTKANIILYINYTGIENKKIRWMLNHCIKREDPNKYRGFFVCLAKRCLQI